MPSGFVAVAFELSFTCTVKLNVPAVVGVPEIVPLDPKFNPAGIAPAVAVHVYPPLPPVAASVAEYAEPTVAPGRDGVVTLNAGVAAATVMPSPFVAVAFELSFTCTVK